MTTRGVNTISTRAFNAVGVCRRLRGLGDAEGDMFAKRCVAARVSDVRREGSAAARILSPEALD
jgi:hypothetical protein